MSHRYVSHPHFSRLMRLEKKWDIAKFSIAGFLIWSSDFVSFFILYQLLHLDLLPATVAAYVIGLTVSYLLSRFWVFRDDVGTMSYATNLTRYFVMLGINLVLTYVILEMLQVFYGIEPVIGKFFVAAFMYVWTYVTNKVWVFRGVPAKAARKTKKKTRYARAS